jgi:hypothetical protein
VVRERHAGGRDVVAVGRLELMLAAVGVGMPVGAAAKERVAPAARGLDVQALTVDCNERAKTRSTSSRGQPSRGPGVADS